MCILYCIIRYCVSIIDYLHIELYSTTSCINVNTATAANEHRASFACCSVGARHLSAILCFFHRSVCVRVGGIDSTLQVIKLELRHNLQKLHITDHLLFYEKLEDRESLVCYHVI
jgi:hypothetical protein